MYKRVLSGLFALALLAMPSVAAAQGVQVGMLTGTVQDSAGLVLPGVTVTVQSPALQGVRSTVTDANGVFVMRALPPGVYRVTFELQGFQTVTEEARVDLGRPTDVSPTLAVAGLAETVNVVAQTDSALATPQGGANYKYPEIDALATPRTLSGIAELAPGVTDNTPNTGQVTIAGAFAYDNVFLIDGVDVNDNLFGDPDNLFIEDAIEETQILTSGISAEYGRFSGGVINAITKSGGNRFSGSLRANLTNPSWTDETPFENAQDIERPDKLSRFYEGTFGGPIVRDRLWFFTAGRYQDEAESVALDISGAQLTETTENRRYEVKLKGTLAQNHTVQGSYLNNKSELFERVFDFSIDPRAVNSPETPNDLLVFNYRGVMTPKVFVEAQFSRKNYRVENAGGTLTDIHDSPFIATSPVLGLYNAPYFDATDPEDRDNQQVTGSLSYFLTTARTGSHDIKTGFEVFTSTNTGGNSQSPTNYVFWTDYLTDIEGNPVFTSGDRFIPRFIPEQTFVNNWVASRGAKIDIRTTSLYVHDRWTANRHVTFDLGVRYERVRSEATGGIIGVDTDTIVPRLGVSYDPIGNGKWVVQGTYAHYAGKYSEAQFSANTNVGNPDLLQLLYVGPAGAGLDFAPGFDLENNYVVVNGIFNQANVLFEDGLSSPVNKEFTLAVGRQLGGSGYARVQYVNRRVRDFVEDFIDLTTGSTSVERDGQVFGPFNNRVYRNTNLPRRDYQALVFQGTYRITPSWSWSGHYTLQLENDGNFEGEATNQPAIPTDIGDYPEIFNEERHFPVGRLPGFQRHKIRLWSIYNFGLGRFGSMDVSGMWRYDSGTAYSLVTGGDPLTDVQTALGAAYFSAPTTQTVYFGERGRELFDGAHLVDFAVNYSIPVFRSVRPWLKLELRNAFNNKQLIAWNTNVFQDPASPTDALGLHTGFTRDPLFGQADSNDDYPIPRTFLASLGFRF